MEGKPTIYIVDDDESVRRSLRWLIESVHYSVEEFASGEAFLAHYEPSGPACLILDIRMNGLKGPEVQQALMDRGYTLPIIVMTGHGDVRTCTKAFKLGAFDFIEKPANDQLLIDAIHKALAADAAQRRQECTDADLRARLAQLTPRESEVIDLIVNGKNQKQIALELNIGFQTVAKHRAKVFAKLGLNNDVELTRLILAIRNDQ